MHFLFVRLPTWNALLQLLGATFDQQTEYLHIPFEKISGRKNADRRPGAAVADKPPVAIGTGSKDAGLLNPPIAD